MGFILLVYSLGIFQQLDTYLGSGLVFDIQHLIFKSDEWGIETGNLGNHEGYICGLEANTLAYSGGFTS